MTQPKGQRGGGSCPRVQEARSRKTVSSKYFMTDDHTTEFDEVWLGWIMDPQFHLAVGWVALGQLFGGLGWVWVDEMDPRTTLA